MVGNTTCPQKSAVCFDTNHYRNIFLFQMLLMLMQQEIVSCLNQYFVFNGGHQLFRFHQDVFRSPCQYHLTVHAEFDLS